MALKATYKKGIPRPATESRHNFITVSGELLKMMLDIKKAHQGQDKLSKHMNKGEIANRMLSDYVDLCEEKGMKILFEMPYNVHVIRDYQNFHKLDLKDGVTVLIGDPGRKKIKTLTTQIFIHGKGLLLVNKTRDYIAENYGDPNIPVIVTYFLERHHALVKQLGIDYVEQYKKKYRLV